MLINPTLNTRAYIGLGSNLGDRAGNLLLAVRGMMNAHARVARLSAVYETAPVGMDVGQPLFLNMVAEVDVARLTPEQLLAHLLRIEYALGRRRDTLNAARTIDLDLLIYGDETRTTEFLTLPHPRLHLRRFVLTPLAELAPHDIHPTLCRGYRQLLSELTDASAVTRWRPGGNATNEEMSEEINES